MACNDHPVINMNRATAARYSFAPNQIDNVLYDAFGQRTVSTIFNQINQPLRGDGGSADVSPAVSADDRPHHIRFSARLQAAPAVLSQQARCRATP